MGVNIVIVIFGHIYHFLSLFVINIRTGDWTPNLTIKSRLLSQLSYTDAYNAPDGYCPHMLRIKSSVYYLSTTDAYYFGFRHFRFCFRFIFFISFVFYSTGGGIRNHTISSFWEKLLCQLGYACVPDARFGLAKPASWVPYVYQFHQSGLIPQERFELSTSLQTPNPESGVSSSSTIGA